MGQTRYETGTEQLKMIDGIGGENVIRSLENVAPDLGKYIGIFYDYHSGNA